MIARALALAALLFPCASAHADSVTGRITPLQKQWAIIKYETPDEDKRASAAHDLRIKAAQLAADEPLRAEPKIWHAIALATEAHFDRKLLSLSQVKQARTLLEEAIAIDGTVLDGAAYAYLGALYDYVPNWPLSYGDWEEADNMLTKALEISPDNIDANYFYGKHLASRKKYDEAVLVLKKALGAPARPGRMLEDEGRRKELRLLIAENEIKTNRTPGSDVNK